MAHRNARLTQFGRGAARRPHRAGMDDHRRRSRRQASAARRRASGCSGHAVEGAPASRTAAAVRAGSPTASAAASCGRWSLLRLRRRMGPAPIAWRLGLAGSTRLPRPAPPAACFACVTCDPSEPVVRYAGERRRARPPRHQDALEGSRRAGAGASWVAAGRPPSRHRLELRARGGRRRHSAGLRRGAAPTSAATTAAAFLERALAFYAGHGVAGRAAAHRQRLPLPRTRLPRAGRASAACGICALGPTGRRPTARPRPS